ncbi:EscU/YscU/HrcU family type III secretion system export apparatus switch protein [Acidiphilium sp. AL]|uniref:EscU/YscU/HrcU family type III secretion system export apparatus switch protein n=1 Tax=Acidiphilium iwatense TaxID=768198 RepID=A0ABS9DXC0_9PROT|nr:MULTISPECIES: EscU/YscU/HrcU family type III secretion system export apparatus switch protein [Acidiphilium]MCF3947392.1 EscU/YscU/HrcU family type III secretion system export apparatus switch protein [Acidiphilium iwatense]MCU4161721.1 EscU/YscU/HrcU family type III secretion system export apparatus switch protein [Acidiphilium sp. AL]
MAEPESRTEAATPTRLVKAHNDGEAPISREVSTMAGLGAALLVLGSLLPAAALRLSRIFSGILSHAGSVGEPGPTIRLAFHAALTIVLPIAGAATLGTLFATLVQTRFRLRITAITLRFNRLIPLGGLSSLFSAQHAIETLQSVGKLCGLGAAIYLVLIVHAGHVIDALVLPVPALPAMILRLAVAVVIAAMVTHGAIAAADFVWTRTQFAIRLRMSHAEVKDEQKELDGNPAIKARLRALRARRTKQTMKAAMGRASVVVTNPTHYAVALEYRQGQAEAPKIVAKGADRLAGYIRELARDNRIPIVANPPLARALFRLDVESEIAPEHYKAVAEIIAYIWKLADVERQRAYS